MLNPKIGMESSIKFNCGGNEPCRLTGSLARLGTVQHRSAASNQIDEFAFGVVPVARTASLSLTVVVQSIMTRLVTRPSFRRSVHQ